MSSLAIEINGLTKAYQRRVVLRELELSVKSGEIVGLLGPNGAGKTTLLKVIAGLSRPDAGQVDVFGLSAAKRSRKFCRMIGMVPQENNIERELSIYDSLRLYAQLYGVTDAAARVDAVIAQFDMQDWTDKTVDEVSGGMARRAMIARVVIPQPRLLLLDEPSVGLDPDMRREVWAAIDALRRDGTSVVITTHYMEEAERLCDRIALLRDGKIVHMSTVEEMKRLATAKSGRHCDDLETAFLQLVRGEAV